MEERMRVGKGLLCNRSGRIRFACHVSAARRREYLIDVLLMDRQCLNMMNNLCPTIPPPNF
jgi:hypothetical protein